jgi:hypothetical protein
MTSYTLQVQPQTQYTIEYSNQRGPQGPAGSNASATTDASLLVSGFLSDARLSDNIARLSAANVFEDKQSFAGVDHAGLCLQSLTTAQYNALTPANGDLFRDSTTDRIDARLTRGTVELVDTAGGQTIGGNLAVTSLFVGGSSGPQINNNSGIVRIQNNAGNASVPIGIGSDVTLSRNASGVMQVGTTAANALGSLVLTNLTASGTVTNQGIRLLDTAGGTLRGVLNCPSWDISYVALRNGTLAETAANTAVYQSSMGDTSVNAPSGRGVAISIANAPVIGVTSGAVAITGTLAYTGSLVFPELVTNGGFDSDTAWSKGTGWTVSGGTAVATGVTGFADIQQNLTGVVLGQSYVIEFTITHTSGQLQIFLGGSGSSLGQIAALSVSGTYSFLFHKNKGEAVKTILFRGNASWTGTIDNVSVKRAF